MTATSDNLEESWDIYDRHLTLFGTYHRQSLAY